jgi:hypothetical protein
VPVQRFRYSLGDERLYTHSDAVSKITVVKRAAAGDATERRRRPTDRRDGGGKRRLITALEATLLGRAATAGNGRKERVW